MSPRTPSTAALRTRLTPLYIAVGLQGFMLWVPIEKLFMSEIGFRPADVGVMAVAYSAFVPIVEVPSGLLADRWSRRGVLVLASVALALTSLVGGMSTNVPTYIGGALLLGVYFAMNSGTVDALVYDMTLEETGSANLYERQIGGVRAVEISLDGGTNWVPCRLQHGNRPDAWSLWFYEWRRPLPGHHQLMVRAIDGYGKVQTAKRQGAFPDGATGYDYLDVNAIGA